MFHQIHRLNSLRKAIVHVRSRNGSDSEGDTTGSDSHHAMRHSTHCLNQGVFTRASAENNPPQDPGNTRGGGAIRLTRLDHRYVLPPYRFQCRLLNHTRWCTLPLQVQTLSHLRNPIAIGDIILMPPSLRHVFLNPHQNLFLLGDEKILTTSCGKASIRLC